MKENNETMVAVTVYYATLEFCGQWYKSTPSEDVDDALNFVKRARLATHAKNMRSNIVEDVAYKPAG
jgi:hypothetical protein